MRFARFQSYGMLSNWGSYSPQERTLLKLEDEVNKYFASLEDFIRRRGLVKNLINTFSFIQHRSDVKQSEYGAMKTQLESIVSQAKSIRLDVLNTGGSLIPDAPMIFYNRLPGSFDSEYESYKIRKRQLKENEQNLIANQFVIRRGNDVKNTMFHDVIRSGMKVIYTVDIDGRIAIGSGEHVKHSVLAKGANCKAAGTAQLQIDDRTDVYGTMIQYRQDKIRYDRILLAGNLNGISLTAQQRQEFSDNANAKQSSIDDFALYLRGWTPSPIATSTILIDFDSGHYAPSKAWKEAMDAWKSVGYIPKWNPESSRV